MEDGSIPDSRITASTIFHERPNAVDNCRPENGRLNNPGGGRIVGGWCPARNDKAAPWFQVDLGELLLVEGVIMQGAVDPLGAWNERVTEYQVQYSDDGVAWLYVTGSEDPGTVPKTFEGNVDLTTPVTSNFDRPIQARYIRIRPTAYFNWPSMRIELIGCKAKEAVGRMCSKRLGMEDGSIPDTRITASTIFHERPDAPDNCRPENGRLNNPGGGRIVGGWCPARNDKAAPWFQVDLGGLLLVEGIIMQGAVDPLGAWNERVTEYQVQYSGDGVAWLYVTGSEDPGTVPKTFEGNVDLTTPVTSSFDRPIQARYIRIRPTAYFNWPSMRIELIGCKAATSDCVPFRGECLYICSDPSKWLDANVACQRMHNGSRLVTVVDQDMNDFIAREITRDVWIGLHDTHNESNWKWVDDTPFDYTNFNSDSEADHRGDGGADSALTPDHAKNCALLLSNTGKWRATNCNSYNGRICALPRGEQLCPDGGTFFRDRCYWYNQVGNWDNANRDCEERFGKGVKLVIVRDAELNAFLSRHVHPAVWLGLRYYQQNDTWYWVDGSPLDPNGYERWGDVELDPSRDERYCAVLNYNDETGGHWSPTFCSQNVRTVCALQTCYDGPSRVLGSWAGQNSRQSDEDHECLDFGSKPRCSCVSGALCRLTGKCHCEALFPGMKCNKDEMMVTIHAPNRLERGETVTMRCHVNVPSIDITVLWRKVSGTEMLPEGRTVLLDRPESGDYDLTIEKVQENDTGSYVCVATTVIGQIGTSKMDSTYLHVVVPNTVTPKPPRKVSEGNEQGVSPKEKGLIFAVAALGVCFVCLLAAFIIVKVRQETTLRRTRRSSDVLM
ncbi:uncharacterized protein LOC110984447 isoform X2 [Acanthaster planci]|nr:uncharacterized protein LOC110984447 isoform X2 [Acanthaster planci]